jgi:hypothetical protein
MFLKTERLPVVGYNAEETVNWEELLAIHPYKYDYLSSYDANGKLDEIRGAFYLCAKQHSLNIEFEGFDALFGEITLSKQTASAFKDRLNDRGLPIPLCIANTDNSVTYKVLLSVVTRLHVNGLSIAGPYFGSLLNEVVAESTNSVAAKKAFVQAH